MQPTVVTQGQQIYGLTLYELMWRVEEWKCCEITPEKIKKTNEMSFFIIDICISLDITLLFFGSLRNVFFFTVVNTQKVLCSQSYSLFTFTITYKGKEVV